MRWFKRKPEAYTWGDYARDVLRAREELSGVPDISRGPSPVLGDEDIPDVYANTLHTQTKAMDDQIGDMLRSVWAPLIQEQLRMPMLILGDGWPRRWVLFPRIDRWERTLRYRKRDVLEWWSARPTWLGGDGLPDSY